MSKTVLLCESCPSEITSGEEIVVKTSKGKLTLCPKCASVSENAPIPEVQRERKLTEKELWEKYLKDEQEKVKDMTNDELVARLALLESIMFEAKVRAIPVAGKLRATTSAKDRYEKQNLSDPKNSPLLKKSQEKHKVELTKLEKSINGWIQLGYEDGDILDMYPEGKFKGHEVREAIAKLRKS